MDRSQLFCVDASPRIYSYQELGPNQMVEYLQVTDYQSLQEYYFRDDCGEATIKPEWVPTIEPPGTFNGS